MALIRLLAVSFASIAMIASVELAPAAPVSTDWAIGHNSRVRLLTGRVGSASAAKSYAFVEIELEPGWKTYWRMPGDAGGVPPQFDWAGSKNLVGAKVLYPAPRRISDSDGDAVGYKGTVMLPVELTATNAALPVELSLKIEYGVCKEICIPAEATLEVEVPPGTEAQLPEGASEALAHVPRPANTRRPDDPQFVSAAAKSDGGKDRIVLTARFPGDPAVADAFVEAPGGIYLSLPKKLSGTPDGIAVFEVQLGPYDQLADLKGKTLNVTLVGERGEAEAAFSID